MRPICSSLNWPRGARLQQDLGVDRVDDLHVARQQPLEQRHRPAFQRFGQQRVVGVGEGALGDVPGRVEIDAVDVHQQPHQFGHGDRRMRVVEMDRRLVRQRQQVAILAEMALHDVLQRGRGEEIFLPQPQFLSGEVRNRPDRARAISASALLLSRSAPMWSPALKASSRIGSIGIADHSRSVLTRLPRQPTTGVS